MGAQESKESEAKNILKVANLNFSGQQSSPFQYFSLEHQLEEQELNHIFSQVMKIAEQQMDKKQLFNEQTMKRISQIDKVIKLQRYSPLYNQNCGIIQGKFADREQFKKEWMKTLKETYGWKKLKKKVKEEKKANIVQNQMRQEKKKQAVPAKKNQKKPLPTVKETNEKQEIRIENEKGANKEKAEKEQKQAQFYGNDEYEQCIADYKEDLDRLRAFDYLVYASILRYVYEHPEMDTIIKDRACNKYRGFMESFFSKTYLNNNKKIIETIDFIVRNDVDVLFVQQATEKLCNELQKRDPDYRIIMSKQRPNDPGLSVIIFKQSSFKKSNIGRKGNLKLLQIAQDKKLREDVKKNFLSWGKCSFISIDNFILISCHSKSFTSQMQNDLKIIRQKFPGKYVIVGGTLSKGCKRYDSGDSDNTKGQYDMYPSGLATCYKKRTFMQFQRKKAGQLIKTQTNFLLYDRRLNLTNADDYINSKEDIYKGVFTIKNTLVEIQAVDDSKKKNMLNGNKNQKNSQGEVDLVNIELLPSQQHPFDQLIVLTTLKIPPRIKKNARKGGKNLTKQEKDRLQFQTSSSEEEEKNEYRPGN